MALLDELTDVVTRGLAEDFTITSRTSGVVPDPADMSYSTGVKMQATYLYADMADSTKLATSSPHTTVAAILRSYLEVTVRIIRAHDGHVRSFDGDRVMGVFAGDGRAAQAVRAAMKINYMSTQVIQPAIYSKYKSIKESGWKLRAVSGVASSEATMIRVGIRNNDDLVSIGIAPNLAARLSELRTGTTTNVYIGKGTYKLLTDSEKLSQGVNMWRGPYDQAMGGGSYPYMQTTYRRKP